MATITTYRQLLRDAIAQHAELYRKYAPVGIEEILIFDDERKHYLWLESGGELHQRVQRIIVHARIQSNQIWTEDGIATTLLQAGVPATDIVLAFHDPALRTSPNLPLGDPLPVTS
jgi:XisI protein